MFTAPLASTTALKKSTMAIMWKSESVPTGASVSISLYSKTGQSVGVIKNNLPVNGTYYWTVPAQTVPVTSTCTADIFTCLSQIAQTDQGCTDPP